MGVLKKQICGITTADLFFKVLCLFYNGRFISFISLDKTLLLYRLQPQVLVLIHPHL